MSDEFWCSGQDALVGSIRFLRLQECTRLLAKDKSSPDYRHAGRCCLLIIFGCPSHGGRARRQGCSYWHRLARTTRTVRGSRARAPRRVMHKKQAPDQT